jgi:hypothetical protein
MSATNQGDLYSHVVRHVVAPLWAKREMFREVITGTSRCGLKPEMRFGSSMRHDVEYVESIQSETSGKYRFCVSKLDGAGVFGAGS